MSDVVTVPIDDRLVQYVGWRNAYRYRGRVWDATLRSVRRADPVGWLLVWELPDGSLYPETPKGGTLTLAPTEAPDAG